jgi:hypothetical protein
VAGGPRLGYLVVEHRLTLVWYNMFSARGFMAVGLFG